MASLQNKLQQSEETNQQLVSQLQLTERSLAEKESKLSLARDKLVKFAFLVENEEERKVLLEEISLL